MAISGRPGGLQRRRRELLHSRPFRVLAYGRRPGRRRGSSSPSGKQQNKEKEQVTAEEAAACRKILYMMTQIATGPPITQALYAVDLSFSSYGTCELPEVKNNPESPSLYPVIEFPYGDYPMMMCFSMLGTKLYFFGGHFTPEDTLPTYLVCSPKVYYIDTTENPLLRTTDPKSVMREAPPMLSGKPNCYGFVAHGKLYAIGTESFKPGEYRLFEFYDPGIPDQGWLSLPDPPDKEAVVDANAVVGDKVVFITTSGVYSFDLVSREWTYIYPLLPRCDGVYGEAVLIEDNKTLYWGNSVDYGVASLGPIEDPNYDLLRIQSWSAAGDFSRHLKALLPEHFPTARLHYMGNDIFCYAMLGAPPHPDIPDDPDIGRPGDPKKSLCSIIVFQVPREAICRRTRKLLPPDKFLREVPLAVKVLQAKRFFCKSKSKANHSSTILSGCFSTPFMKQMD